MSRYTIPADADLATLQAIREQILADAEGIAILRAEGYATEYAVPVTLRQIEAAGIRTNAMEGVDNEEHEGMLDQEGVWRAVFGVDRDAGQSEPYVARDVQVYSIMLGDAELEWKSALLVYTGPWVTYTALPTDVERLLDVVVPSYSAIEDMDRMILLAIDKGANG